MIKELEQELIPSSPNSGQAALIPVVNPSCRYWLHRYKDAQRHQTVEAVDIWMARSVRMLILAEVMKKTL